MRRRPTPAELIPAYGNTWEIGVLYGPHGAPSFFWPSGLLRRRLGGALQLQPPRRAADRPQADLGARERRRGRPASSSIASCEYAIGSINFTGDSPVILTRDGPGLGGFVCPVTIARAKLWKVGQVKPSDRIRFVRIDYAEAVARASRRRTRAWRSCAPWPRGPPRRAPPATASETIIAALPATDTRPSVSYRQAGDGYLLLEYGDNVLDLALRMRIHLLMEALAAADRRGLRTVAGRAFAADPLRQPRDPAAGADRAAAGNRIATGRRGDAEGADPRGLPADGVRGFGHAGRGAALPKRCAPARRGTPNNVDFIQRINGLASREDVRRIVFDANYLIMGLGDVYLGAVRGADRSAPSAARPQVQPGAHLHGRGARWASAASTPATAWIRPAAINWWAARCRSGTSS